MQKITIESDAELYAKANSLIESIFEFKRERCEGLSLMESIIEYGIRYNIPIQELGNIIADHKDFVGIFKKQLVKDKYFKEDLDSIDKDGYEDDEW